MRLYLIRHPRTVIGVDTCYGSSDVAVAPHEQERVLCTLRGAKLPAGLPVYSSPLQRCARLAESLAYALGSPEPQLDARLAEMHFGSWELRAWNDIPRAEIDAWAADVVRYQPGDGESVLEMARRIQSFYNYMLALRQDRIVVCHAGAIRMLLACRQYPAIVDIARHAAKNRMEIPYGQVFVLNAHRRAIQ